MTITDYLLLGAFAAAVFYTGYRLLLGWLRTPPDEIVSETSNIPKRNRSGANNSGFAVEPTARVRGLASDAAAEIADMSSQIR
jgi:hypothetical protein